MICSVFLFDKIREEKSVLFFIGYIFFAFLMIFSIFLSIYYLANLKKPLLIIKNDEIQINNFLAKSTIVNFSNIKSINLITQYNKGIPTNKQILIEVVNPSEKYKNSFIYKVINEISTTKIANSQFVIQCTFLDIKSEKLLDILNKKLKYIEKRNSKIMESNCEK